MKYGWSVRISFSLEKEEIAKKKFWELKSCAIKRAAYIVETIAKRFAPPLSFRVFRISDVVCVRDKTIAARPWNANAYRVVARVKPEVGTSVRSQRPRSLRVFRRFYASINVVSRVFVPRRVFNDTHTDYPFPTQSSIRCFLFPW